jgi:hypothetical protein
MFGAILELLKGRQPVSLLNIRSKYKSHFMRLIVSAIRLGKYELLQNKIGVLVIHINLSSGNIVVDGLIQTARYSSDIWAGCRFVSSRKVFSYCRESSPGLLLLNFRTHRKLSS